MNGVARGNEPPPIHVMIIVGPVEVRTTVRVDIREIDVAVRIDPRSLCIQYHPDHHPSNALRVVSYSEPRSSLVLNTK